MKLDSKLARQEGSIPVLTGLDGNCQAAVLSHFLAGDSNYLATATKADMDEYWNFVARLAVQEGSKVIVFSDYVRTSRKFIKFNNVCATNFYDFLRRRPKVYGRVTSVTSCVKSHKGSAHNVRVFTWVPGRAAARKRIVGTCTIRGDVTDFENSSYVFEDIENTLRYIKHEWGCDVGVNDFSLELE